MRKEKSPGIADPWTTLARRLDILILLNLGRQDDPKKKPTTSEKIVKLNELGLEPSEIAQIVRKPVNYVTASLYTRKKRQKKR